MKVLMLCPSEETQRAADVPRYLSSPPCHTQGQTGPQWVVVLSDQGVSVFAVVKMSPGTGSRTLVRRYTEVLAGQTANSRLIFFFLFPHSILEQYNLVKSLTFLVSSLFSYTSSFFKKQ